jgi:hypothetical protein
MLRDQTADPHACMHKDESAQGVDGDIIDGVCDRVKDRVGGGMVQARWSNSAVTQLYPMSVTNTFVKK